MRRYPGDPPVSISLASDPSRGDSVRITTLSLGVHTGTHVDAPNHLQRPPGVRELRGDVRALPIDAMIGPALVVQAPRRRPLEPADLGASICRGARVMFRGSPIIKAETAREMVRRGVALVGTDGLSIDPMEPSSGGELPAHRLLLRAGVVLLEGLLLTRARPGRYWMAVLPLLIPGSDGAPARAVLRPAQRPRK